MTLVDEVYQVFRVAFELDGNFVLIDSMSFEDVPGWDSLGHMRLVQEIESKIGICLEMEEIIDLDSVGAVRKLFSRKRVGNENN